MAQKNQTPIEKKGFFDTLRYVNDFQTEDVIDEKGKTRKKITYIGTWNVFRDTGRGTLIKLVSSAVLSILATVFAFKVLLMQHAFGGEYVVMVPFMVLLFPMFYLLMGAISLPYRRKPMRRDEYMHGMIRMQRSSVAIIAFAGVGTIASFILRAVRNDWLFLKEDWLFLVFAILIIACCGGILWVLQSLELAELPNKAFAQENGKVRI
ncbi:MAG: hypothetical protein J5589_00330 [Firmicutes bacterium]|nr:hypothetical protein [Bacillota bacterium]